MNGETTICLCIPASFTKFSGYIVAACLKNCAYKCHENWPRINRDIHSPRPGTVKPVHTGMPWGQTFIPVWTGSGLERVFAFGQEQTTIT